MRRGLSLLLIVSLSFSMLTSCFNKKEEVTEKTTESSEIFDASQNLGEPVKLVVSLSAVSTDTHAKAMSLFKDTVTELSDGNITVELNTDAKLVQQDQETTAVSNGEVDIVLSSASWLSQNSPWISMFTAGYMFKDNDHMDKTLNGEIGDKVFSKISDEQGILPLGAWYLGTREISLTDDRPITSPNDLKDVNLRMPNSESWLFLGKALGANPKPVTFNELYLALQTGLVEGQDNPLPTFESAKFYEVQKSVTLTDHLVDSVWPTININTWNSLSEPQKQIVMKGIEAGRVYCSQINLQREADLIEFLENQGISIYESDKEAFADHVLNEYLNNSISDSWDLELYKEVVALGN